jgi:hypothetical protein
MKSISLPASAGLPAFFRISPGTRHLKPAARLVTRDVDHGRRSIVESG